MSTDKPEPAAGQVWTFDGDAETGATPCGPYVVRSVNAIEAMFAEGGCAGLDWMRTLSAWKCAGVEYPIVTPQQAKAVGALVRDWIAKRPPVATVSFLGRGLAAAPDPRIARERQRAEIDVVLREDARRHPAFATARGAAVLCVCEGGPGFYGVTYPSTVRAMLGWLHEYEALRGGLTAPREAAARHARATFGDDACGHYERARGMR